MKFRWLLGLFGSIGLLQAEPSAAVALVHGATLVSFDRDYEAIARVSALNLQLITRPG